MDNLKQLDAQTLSEIIKEFNGKIFQSEAQFQFELAWKLNEKYGNGDNLAVELEDMGMYEKEGEKVKQKSYTDIVVKQGKYRVAIELKYKTAKYDNKKMAENDNKINIIYLFDHSAVDLGRYDYLWDVHRMELLKGESKSKDSGEEKIEVQKNCHKGFAVLLTNEKKYWEENKKNKNEDVTKRTIDYQFRFPATNESLFDKILDWKKDENDAYTSTVKDSFRAHRIKLNKAYHYKWYDYRDASADETNGTFKYVIIEV